MVQLKIQKIIISIVYCQQSQHRGKGYGKTVLEAGVDFGFEILNMNRIDTEVLENNFASMKTALYVGYVKEGIKRKAIHKCGEYLDSIVLGILKEDWSILDRVFVNTKVREFNAANNHLVARFTFVNLGPRHVRDVGASVGKYMCHRQLG